MVAFISSSWDSILGTEVISYSIVIKLSLIYKKRPTLDTSLHKLTGWLLNL